MKKKLVMSLICSLLMAAAYAEVPPPPRDGFDGPPPKEMKRPHEDFAKKKEFETRLQLTEEQKASIEKNIQKNRKKLEAIRKKEMKLKKQRRDIIEKSKKDFENLLTPAQKEELKKIEQERKIKKQKCHEEMKKNPPKRVEKKK